MNGVELDPTSPIDLASELSPRVTLHPDDLLPTTGASLDPLAELEELLVKMKIEDRQRAREERVTEETRIERAAREQIAAIEDKADASCVQGMFAAGGQVLGGALTAYGGYSAFGVSDSDADAQMAQWGGVGKVAEGTGQLGAAFMNYPAVDAEAGLIGAQTRRETAERRAADAASQTQLSGDELRALLDRLQKIRDAEISAQRAAMFSV
jgi:hypothetical protein